MKTRSVELLSPARNLTCGIEAINHGADAVYIGAPKFGARAAASNPVDDICRLCDHAHLFGARIYVAFNTILREEELPQAERLIRQLYAAGADALIIQDMGITQLDIPPIPLHASTQTDNRTPEKVNFLHSAGFSQVVLARELSLNQIRQIARQTSIALEVFIHGALCVSFSGQCYLSAALGGRSANRGECAQYCRLPYTLTDAGGQEIVRGKHLLSLADLNRSDELEALLDAGVTSFKIEGRLKELSYVKNITAWYRRQLDAILARRPEYCRASAGQTTLAFEPTPRKSFNRGFTPYFLHGRTPSITAFDTPKSVGEPVGTVKERQGNVFTLAAGAEPLNNGDGLTFFNAQGKLEGFRVNRVAGNRVYPAEMPALLPLNTPLFRNYDQAFEKQLSLPSAERKIAVAIAFSDNSFGFTLRLTDEAGGSVSLAAPFRKEPARLDPKNNILRQLSKMGNTPFHVSSAHVSMSRNWFVPSSLLSEMRRQAVERLCLVRKILHRREAASWKNPPAPLPFPERELTYRGNVFNTKAEAFYRIHGVETVAPAFELSPPGNVPLMFTKHCLRYSLGWCPSLQKKGSPYKEPFYLLHKHTRLRLQFDCDNCRMLLFAAE
ncbi:MAG: U32 family peptidase [Tannerellaceae bacterium]|jgi:putative protease|nr:U32 family peptidase [Tannerellaceae bacterium]